MSDAFRNKTGFLKVDNTHKMYFEDCGNIESEHVILFVHGGPGGGFFDKDKRFFDFKKHRVIFFDQRGASKSLPFGEIKENTTQNLVDDINKLLDYLKVEKVSLFGGSWGTTLSLVYAIQNPKRVHSIILRAIFLANKASIDYYVNGGVAKQFPKIWERFKNNVPAAFQNKISAYYLHKMLNGNEQEKKHFAYEWAFYETSIYKKNITENQVDELVNQFPFESLAILEAHYMSNHCFLEENYILNNTNFLIEIPIHIVHGSEDVICPVNQAKELHAKLTNSNLYIVNAGHADSEPEIEHKLMELIVKLFQ